MIKGILETLTKESNTIQDEKLDDLQAEAALILPVAIHIISEIIKRKIKLFWMYRWQRVLLISLLLVGIGYGGYKIFNYIKTPAVLVHYYDPKIELMKDSVISIDNVINPQLLEYFDYIASTESKNYQAYNETSDAWGRYQFVPIARQDLANRGFSFSKNAFMSNPELQDVMMYIFLKLNDAELQDTYNKYDKKYIKGYYFTKAGMLSMAHAIGAGGVKNFIKNLEATGQVVLPPGAPIADRRLSGPRISIKFKK